MAEFLRSRREQLQPADVGLPDSRRRRTPGLRREEVATLAGISIDYLVRLEQGRDSRPSASVIVALAGALRLDDDGLRQLSMLARVSETAALCPAAGPLARAVAPTVRALLQRLATTPAFVVGPANDVLAGNGTWGRLVQPLGLLENAEPNLARYVFLHQDARRVYPDWAAAADDQVRRLRAASVRWGDNERFVKLMDELRTAPDFVERWSKFATTEKRRGTTAFCIPTSGASESTTRCSFPMMSTSNDSSPGSQPTVPPPMLLPVWATPLLHRVRRSFVSSAEGK